MNRCIKSRLHLSTIASDCVELAKKHSLGLEIADFCWAYYLDNDLEAHEKRVRASMEGLGSFWFHAPFAELAPCAIDPRARELARFRYNQSIELASRLGIKRLVIHGGYIPLVYFPESYVEQSIKFWREFMKCAPSDIQLALENVMEPSPDMLVEIVRGVDDERLGLCLDVGHANCCVSSMPPLDWIEPMSERLFHVHIHDNSGDMDTHSPLGRGNIPFAQVLDRVIALCPRASFTIENQQAAESVEFLIAHGCLEK